MNEILECNGCKFDIVIGSYGVEGCLKLFEGMKDLCLVIFWGETTKSYLNNHQLLLRNSFGLGAYIRKLNLPQNPSE